jgi:hypothetical protein
MMEDITAELHRNSIDDLHRFIKKRECLNNCNMYLIYIYYFLQTCGIVITSLSANSQSKELLWIGIILNALASLINIYEKTNQSIADKMLDNIKHIRSGNYLDESNLVDAVK